MINEIDPVLMGMVWATIFVLRGLIPERLISIDGKATLWGMALVGSVLALAANGTFNGLETTQEVAGAVLAVFATTAGAIMADGAAKYSGLSETLREVVTLGGRTNTP